VNSSSRAHWGNRFAFVLAAAGSAIGLGNIWKFPYITGHNGGGAFVLVYLACIAVVGLPILIAEIFIGKKAQNNAIVSFETLHKPKSKWRNIGFLGMLTSSMVLAFYSVVGGWVLDFEFKALTNAFVHNSDEVISGFLGQLIEQKQGLQIFWHSIFMGTTIYIVLKGIADGIEKWVRVLMPVLFVLLIGLFFYAMTLSGFGQAITFLFTPDFTKLSWEGILEAVGHSFFTLTIGMAVMVTYGSYLQPQASVIKTSVIVAVLDTIIALIAGITVFAVVFSFNQEPGAGPGLIFVTLPLLFKQIPGSWLVSNAFFILVTFAALSSSISMLEVTVSYLSDQKTWSRKKASLVVGGVIWAFGLLCTFPNLLLFGSKNTFDAFDLVTSKILLPVGGLLISLYFGWIVDDKVKEELGDTLSTKGLLLITRFFAPALVAYMLFKGVHEML
jgi:NSS family neurotransmitter:Na+ symporter